MKAAEASRRSEQNATELARRAIAASARERENKEEADRKKKKFTYLEELEKKVRLNIDRAVKNGHRSVEHKICDAHHRYHPLYLDFARTFEFAPEVTKMVKKLKLDGYKAEVTENSYMVDTSSAYFNSGGECGSQTPHEECEIIMKISW